MKILNSMKVCILGLGYIGLPTAIISANSGIEVIGVDINPNVVKSLDNGEIHLKEPGLEEMYKKVISNGNLRVSIHPEESDVFIIVVPTPFKNNHEADISYVENATQMIIPFIKKNNLLIIESTSPVGTTNKIKNLIFTKRPELKDQIFLAYCPERVLPGNIIFELINNDRVIGGINSQSTEKAIKYYSRFVKGILHKTDEKTAEMLHIYKSFHFHAGRWLQS